MFNETADSVFVRERILPCRVVVGSMGCIVYTDYVYPAFVPLLADFSCLLFLFRKFLFFFSFLKILFLFLFFFPPLLSHHALYFGCFLFFVLFSRSC